MGQGKGDIRSWRFSGRSPELTGCSLGLSRFDITACQMHGTFNGVRLRRITSITTESICNRTLTTFRVLEFPIPELEAQLRLNSPALTILSTKTVEGRVVRYNSERRNWYEFTVES